MYVTHVMHIINPHQWLNKPIVIITASASSAKIASAKLGWSQMVRIRLAWYPSPRAPASSAAAWAVGLTGDLAWHFGIERVKSGLRETRDKASTSKTGDSRASEGILTCKNMGSNTISTQLVIYIFTMRVLTSFLRKERMIGPYKTA